METKEECAPAGNSQIEKKGSGTVEELSKLCLNSTLKCISCQMKTIACASPAAGFGASAASWQIKPFYRKAGHSARQSPKFLAPWREAFQPFRLTSLATWVPNAKRCGII